LRSRISAALLLAAMLAWAAPAPASAPTVASLDAQSRAGGNRIAVATAVGDRIFTKTWPVQVLQVLANQMGPDLVLGMRLSGVKFHEPVDRRQFDAELATIANEAFAADPAIQELDIWVTVPIAVGKGIIVSGDLAKPTSRTVFTVTIRREESPGALMRRLGAGTGVFVDPEWASTAFTKR
jgi:hypothetical protein